MSPEEKELRLAVVDLFCDGTMGATIDAVFERLRTALGHDPGQEQLMDLFQDLQHEKVIGWGWSLTELRMGGAPMSGFPYFHLREKGRALVAARRKALAMKAKAERAAAWAAEEQKKAKESAA